MEQHIEKIHHVQRTGRFDNFLFRKIILKDSQIWIAREPGPEIRWNAGIDKEALTDRKSSQCMNGIRGIDVPHATEIGERLASRAEFRERPLDQPELFRINIHVEAMEEIGKPLDCFVKPMY